MQRRNALKQVAIALGGLVSLPGWASGWTADTLSRVSFVSPAEEVLVGELVDTFIPETTTPGAKSLKVHQFALRMIQDCYGEPVQTQFRQGLGLVDSTAQQAYNKPFISCDKTQRLEVLSKMAASTDSVSKPFVDVLKKLTVRGYMNSEYYLVNVEKFVMAPGFYHGCVPIAKMAVNGSR